uniref:Uncharacterized protein n=1 Tax=viral metagenome TaxID=1070528 RepID=A0A2V0RAB0_9ZZZZ
MKKSGHAELTSQHAAGGGIPAFETYPNTARSKAGSDLKRKIRTDSKHLVKAATAERGSLSRAIHVAAWRAQLQEVRPSAYVKREHAGPIRTGLAMIMLVVAMSLVGQVRGQLVQSGKQRYLQADTDSETDPGSVCSLVIGGYCDKDRIRLCDRRPGTVGPGCGPWSDDLIEWLNMDGGTEYVYLQCERRSRGETMTFEVSSQNTDQDWGPWAFTSTGRGRILERLKVTCVSTNGRAQLEQSHLNP